MGHFLGLFEVRGDKIVIFRAWCAKFGFFFLLMARIYIRDEKCGGPVSSNFASFSRTFHFFVIRGLLGLFGPHLRFFDPKIVISRAWCVKFWFCFLFWPAFTFGTQNASATLSSDFAFVSRRIHFSVILRPFWGIFGPFLSFCGAKTCHIPGLVFQN